MLRDRPEWYEPYQIDSSISKEENIKNLALYLTDTYGEDTVASHVSTLLIKLVTEEDNTHDKE